MTDRVTSSVRQAALELHGLHPEDQHWVLEQLDPQSRGALAELLDEVEALGIPALPAPGRLGVVPRWWSSLRQAWRLSRLLSAEPAAVWSAVLGTTPPATRFLLQRLAPRRIVASASRSGTNRTRPAMQAAIAQVVREQLEGRQPPDRWGRSPG